MPCWQERTTTLEIQAADLNVMARALEALGMQAQVDDARRTIRLTTRTGGQAGYFANGRLVISERARLDENEVRREYSRQSIIATAKRQGWQLRFQQDGRIEATKRRYA